MSKPYFSVGVEGFDSFPPNKAVANPRPGDFILTHNDGLSSSLIRLGQWLWLWGDKRRYARWNHTALFVGHDGDIVEAVWPHVAQNNVAKYAETEYQVVRVKASDADRQQMVAFARQVVDQPYGALTIVSIALSVLTGLNLNFGFDGQFICSGLVARSLERGEAVFSRDPSHIMPAQLAEYYCVEPPAGRVPRGRVPKK